jgi:hypothetical protein
MNEQEYNQLRETAWRRRLTTAEEAAMQAYLAAHPAEGLDWQAELELNQLLEKMPAAPPVASNFTARVLQAVERENAAQNRQSAASPMWLRLRNWLPKLAVASVLLGLFAVNYHREQVHARTALARSIVDLTTAMPASDSGLTQDFEPIRRLSDSQPKADTELLALMK